MYALLAQTPSVPPDKLGTFILCALVVLLFIERVRAIFFPQKPTIPTDQQPVTRGELAAAVTLARTQVDKDMVTVVDLRTHVNKEISDIRALTASYVTRIELKRLEEKLNELGKEQKDTSRDYHTRYAELSKAIGDLRVELRDMTRNMENAILQRLDEHYAIINKRIDEQEKK